MTATRSNLAIHGGPKAVRTDPGDVFRWPIITNEDEEAVLEVLRRGGMSGTDVTIQFEKEFAQWQGLKYALGFSSGTAALHGAMFGCKIGVGDEIICPSVTYWASVLPDYRSTGGSGVIFGEVAMSALTVPDSLAAFCLPYSSPSTLLPLKVSIF